MRMSLTAPHDATPDQEFRNCAQGSRQPEAAQARFDAALRRSYSALLLTADALRAPQNAPSAPTITGELLPLLLAHIPIGILSDRPDERQHIFARFEEEFAHQGVTIGARGFLRTFLHVLAPPTRERPRHDVLKEFVTTLRTHHPTLTTLRTTQVACIGTGTTDPRLLDRTGGFYVSNPHVPLQRAVSLPTILGMDSWRATQRLLHHLQCPQREHRPRIVLLAAPSGAGKTTIARHLITANPRYTLLVRATDRTPRSGKEGTLDAQEHDFLTTTAFSAYARTGHITFTRTTFEHQYGITATEVNRLLAWPGIILTTAYRTAYQLRATWPATRLVAVGIMPTTDEQLLRKRMRDRDPAITTNDLRIRLQDFQCDVERVRRHADLCITNAAPEDLTPALHTLAACLATLDTPPDDSIALVAYLTNTALGCGWTRGHHSEEWPTRKLKWRRLIDSNTLEGPRQLAGALADAIAACATRLGVHHVGGITLLLPPATATHGDVISVPDVFRERPFLREISTALIDRHAWQFGRRHLARLRVTATVDAFPDIPVPGSLLTTRHGLTTKPHRTTKNSGSSSCTCPLI